MQTGGMVIKEQLAGLPDIHLTVRLVARSRPVSVELALFAAATWGRHLTGVSALLGQIRTAFQLPSGRLSYLWILTYLLSNFDYNTHES